MEDILRKTDDEGAAKEAVEDRIRGGHQVPQRTIVSDLVAVRLQQEEPGKNHPCLASDSDFRARPALYIPHNLEIPSLAAQHAVEYWCADGPPPDLLVSLVCDRARVSLSEDYSPRRFAKVKEGLVGLAERANSWFVSSGLVSDPLAKAAGTAVRKIAEEREFVESQAEFIRAQSGGDETQPHTDVKLFALNSVGIAPETTSASAYEEVESEAEGWHTHFVLLERRSVSEEEVDNFRAEFFLKLAESREELQARHTSSTQRYISLPMKRDGSSGLGWGHRGSQGSPPQRDRIPALVIFAASTLPSLKVLTHCASRNLPALIFHDASDLCRVIYTAHWHYTENRDVFDHFRFLSWLEQELRRIATLTGQLLHLDPLISSATEGILSILRNSEKNLFSFMSLDNSCDLRSPVMRTLLKNNRRPVELLPLLVSLNLADMASGIDISAYLESNFCSSLFRDALMYPYRDSMVSYFLDAGFAVGRGLEDGKLIDLFRNSQHEDFFESVILGHIMGYPGFPQDTRKFLRVDLKELLEELACTKRVAPPSTFLGAPQGETGGGGLGTQQSSHHVLTFWAILMKRGNLAKLLWAYSHDPLPLALVLAQMCLSLSAKMHDWHFHQQYFSLLGRGDAHLDFAKMALALLDISYKEVPYRSYEVLCEALDEYGGVAPTHLAYQAGNKAFVAHQSCQMWVSRLLYGKLQIRNLSWGFLSIPSWVKVVVSAVLVFPMKLWLKPRWRGSGGPPLPRDTSTEIILSNPRTLSFRNPDLDPSRITQSNNSMLSCSVRSLREETLVLNNERTMAEEAGTGRALYTPLPTTERGLNQSEVYLCGSPRKSGLSSDVMSFWEMVGTFYCTPIAKYWLSLIFRLAHLGFFGFALSLPGCGRIDVDLGVWLWSFIAWTESVWLLYLKKQELRMVKLRWQIADCLTVLLFLILMIIFKIVANQPRVHIAEAYVGRSVCAFFLLYLCYSTLFIYIPMSERLGPLVVRMKLMVVRDFVDYLILVVLVVASCAVVVHSVLYPDYPASTQLWHNAFHWAWFSLFVSDTSGLREPEECRRLATPSPQDYCLATGGYSNPTCPTSGWVGYIVVIQSFVFLKLICWPLLFALFAKTAKDVEEEVEEVWKHEFYGLVTDFSLRPPLPPPLTPLVLLSLSCLRAYGRIRRTLTGSSHHPDAGRIHLGSVLKLGKHKDSQYYTYWRALALRYWKEKIQETEWDGSSEKTLPRIPASLLRHQCCEWKRKELDEKYAPWSVLLPNYYPGRYSKPAGVFPESLEEWVEEDDGEGLGFLNPFGRTGMAGRGDLFRFGPNPVVYCVLRNEEGEGILLKKEGDLSVVPKNLCFPGESLLESLKSCFNTLDHRHPLILFLEDCVSRLLDETKSVDPGSSHRFVNSEGDVVCVSCVCERAIVSSMNTDNAWINACVLVISVPLSLQEAIRSQALNDMEFVSVTGVNCSSMSMSKEDAIVVKLALGL